MGLGFQNPFIFFGYLTINKAQAIQKPTDPRKINRSPTIPGIKINTPLIANKLMSNK